MFVPKSENTIKVYEQKNAIQKNHFLGEYYITREYFESDMQGFEVFPGDILVSCAGTIGETYILPDDIEQGIINQALMKMRITDLINKEYFLKYFDHILKDASAESGKGTAIKNIPPFDIFKNFLFPLPPFTEQNLIIKELQRIFSIIDSLETDKSDLQTAIKQAKSKILDLAIHGKLVPQDSSDEPASVLLERLRAEKEAKIKAGELKRDKNDSYIYKNTTDNCYYQKFNKGDGLLIQEKIKFEIPEGWSWCLLRNICSDFIVPQRDKPTRFDGTIPWCRIEDIEGKYLNGSLSNQLVSMKTIKAMNMHICPKGSIICSCSASIGVQAIATVDCCTNQTFIGIVPIEKALFNEYLYYFLGSQTKYFHEIATGTTIKYISRDKFEDFIFPLPPLAEQKRIVEKIENAFAKLDQIAEQLA